MPTICVDFDGTCVTHEYPHVGRDVPFCQEVLRSLVANDHRIILWTMRSGEYLDDAVKWFADKEIPLFGINQNPEQSAWTDSPKAYAQIYIDDAALGCPLIEAPDCVRPFVDWEKVSEWLEKNLAITRLNQAV